MYRLVQGPNGATLESVMLVTYDTAAETGKLAELYVVTGNTVRRATAGYYTAEDLGGVLLYTFTRTDAIESDLKEYLFFEDTFTYLVNDELSVGGMPITVYYVYAHDGAESYTLYTEENGDATLWRNDFGVTGLGSLYFRDGKAVEGSLWDSMKTRPSPPSPIPKTEKPARSTSFSSRRRKKRTPSALRTSPPARS